MALFDSHGRRISDLRVSLTDRCNFRCFYCLPSTKPTLNQKANILTFEELSELCAVFVELGIEKIRLTGGEPLLRKNIERLIATLSELKHPKAQSAAPKLKDLALTTNGYLFPNMAEGLKAAGLDRITLSLDSLKRERFEKITEVDALDKVFESIEAARRVGLEPIKMNAVIVRGWNEDEVTDFARFARENDVKMRFIEFMPLDSDGGWKRELVVSGREIFAAIDAAFPLELVDGSRGSETSWKYRFKDGAPGEVGIIAPVTEMFCGACSRIRLTADGQIRTCLFSRVEYDLRDELRRGASRAEISEFIRAAVNKKEPRHYINDPEFAPATRSMSFIGG
jgi:cyclic pyranopterin phosphate synthase